MSKVYKFHATIELTLPLRNLHRFLSNEKDKLGREVVIAVLTELRGNMKGAARLLGVDRSNLHRYCEIVGIKPDDYRPKKGVDACQTSKPGV